MKLKFITLPEDHGFDEEHLKFLQTLDDGLVKSHEGLSNKEDIVSVKEDLDKKLEELKANFNYDKMQEQLNAIFVKLEEKGLKPSATKEEQTFTERRLNSKWLSTMMRKDKPSFEGIQKELKTLEPLMHLGPATGTGDSDIGLDYSQGGYLVPTLLTTEIFRFIEQGGVARREFRSINFSGPGNTRELHKLLTSVTVTWVSEGEKKPKTKPTTTKVTQTLEEMAAMVIFTEQLISDAAIDWVSYCSSLFGEAIAIEEDNQAFAGVGAPFTGILNDTNTVGIALPASIGPIDMRPEVLLLLPNAVPQNATLGAKFFMHRSIWSAICARRSDSVAEGDAKGVFLVQQPSQGNPASLFGTPVVLVEAMPSLSDLGYGDDLEGVDSDLPFLIYGNLNKCCIYGEKAGINMKVLDQASVYDSNDTLINLAEQNMIALRCYRRVGFVSVLPEGIAVLSTGPVS